MQSTQTLDLLKIKHPIIQGPFGGGLSTVEMVSTVSNLGGLGSFGVHYLEAEGILGVASEIREKTSNPFALNLWVSDHDPEARDYSTDAYDRAWRLFEPLYRELNLPKPEQPPRFHPSFEEQVEAILEAQPDVFSFVFGIPPARVLADCKARGITTVGAATTLAEAQALEAADVDVILATGFEAGGHRPSFLDRAEDSLMGTMPLTRVISEMCSKPVIAAGGIVDAGGIEAALSLGAGAAQLGTAFLACAESGTVDQHRAALFSDRSASSVLTRAYTGRLARGMSNRLIKDMQAVAAQLPPFPVQARFVAPLRAASIAAGDDEFLSLYANQAAPLLKHRKTADLMADLIAGIA